MGKMVIAIAILPKQNTQMVVCQDSKGTVQAWKNLTDAYRTWQINKNNPWALLSTVDVKVGLMVIPDEATGLEVLKKLVGDNPTAVHTHGGFLHPILGLLIPKENHILLDDLLMVRE